MEKVKMQEKEAVNIVLSERHVAKVVIPWSLDRDSRSLVINCRGVKVARLVYSQQVVAGLELEPWLSEDEKTLIRRVIVRMAEDILETHEQFRDAAREAVAIAREAMADMIERGE